MAEIGLFPLAIVLLPTEQVPLHVFEPRYRELIGECLAEERPFGLVFADDDGIRDVGTLARVVSVVQRFDDGRLNIVVEGGERFRLTRLTDGRSYRTAEIEPVEDASETVPDDLAARALALFERVVALAGSSGETPERGGQPLSFALAARFELPPEPKLELLGATSESERLLRVCELLEAAAASLERRHAIAERSLRNGHVPH